VGLARRYLQLRTPSVGSMLDLAAEWSDSALTCPFARTRSAPLSPDTMELPSSRNEPPRRASPHVHSLPLGSPRVGEDKMLLTDFCNRHTTRAPVDRPISEREAFAVTDRYRASLRPTVKCASTPFAVPAPCCLAATRPQIDVRLTAYTELRLHRSQPRNPFLGRAEHHSGWCSRAAAFSTAGKVGGDASDAPCRAPRAPEMFISSLTSRNQDRFHHPRVNMSGLTRPRASSIDNVLPRVTAFAESSVGREPATDPPALPPGLGFRRFFATRNALAPNG